MTPVHVTTFVYDAGRRPHGATNADAEVVLNATRSGRVLSETVNGRTTFATPTTPSAAAPGA